MTWDYDQLEAEATKNVNTLDSALHGRNFNTEAIAISQGANTRIGKMHRLYKLGTDMTSMITPHSACRNGCSHCCNMAVSVTVMEAREISRAIGVEYVNVKQPMKLEDSQDLFRGDPCPFLKSGRCSVYAVRPLACRVYFNMSDTPEICDVVKYPNQDTPCLDARGVQLAQSIALGVGFADIREWFPAIKESDLPT